MKNWNWELYKILSLTGDEGVALRCRNTNEQKKSRSHSVIYNDKSAQLDGYSCWNPFSKFEENHYYLFPCKVSITLVE